MLDYKKLRKDFIKVLNSYSREDLLEWVEMDNKRMALVDMEEKILQPRIVSVGKLNGTTHSAAKSKGVSVKKTTRAKTTRTRRAVMA